MLEYAAQYKDEISSLWQKTLLDPYYKYFHTGSFCNYELKIDSDNWSNLEFVSVSGDKLNGYLSANIDRDTRNVRSVAILKFEKDSFTFSKDMYNFLQNLFLERNFKKISFDVVIGNPIEKMYDRFIERYGGRIVGIKKNDIHLMDGQLYNLKLYEIEKEAFLENYKQ